VDKLMDQINSKLLRGMLATLTFEHSL